MSIKKIVIGTALFLSLGVSSIAFAKADIRFNKVKVQEIEDNDREKSLSRNSMFDMMEQYGYGDLVQDMEEDNYEAMDEFMNNISDADYQNMITMMEEYGYRNMARTMERIGREEMITMHNSMGGAASCH